MGMIANPRGPNTGWRYTITVVRGSPTKTIVPIRIRTGSELAISANRSCTVFSEVRIVISVVVPTRTSRAKPGGVRSVPVVSSRGAGNCCWVYRMAVDAVR